MLAWGLCGCSEAGFRSSLTVCHIRKCEESDRDRDLPRGCPLRTARQLGTRRGYLERDQNDSMKKY